MSKKSEKLESLPTAKQFEVIKVMDALEGKQTDQDILSAGNVQVYQTNDDRKNEVAADGIPADFMGVVWRPPRIKDKLNSKGEPAGPEKSIYNMCEVIAFDKRFFGKIAYDTFSKNCYVHRPLPWDSGLDEKRIWSEFDSSMMKEYLEEKGVLNNTYFQDALRNSMIKFKYHAVQSFLKYCHDKWDGNPHIENLLPVLLGTEKTPYNTEVMRLFMLAAVKRVFCPGSKFDNIIVLLGPQGSLKSTFVEKLAFRKEWYCDSFDRIDKDGRQLLCGKWILEFSEMTILEVNKRNVVKGFLSGTQDTYRAPYERSYKDYRRECVFIGTVNDASFLEDETGNRRYWIIDDVAANKPLIDLHSDEYEAKQMIIQAWGETMDLYLSHPDYELVLSPENLSIAERKQSIHTVDDPDVGRIEAYLENNTDKPVCVSMIWHEALDNADWIKVSPSESKRIENIMVHKIKGWRRSDKVSVRCGKYGPQRKVFIYAGG